MGSLPAEMGQGRLCGTALLYLPPGAAMPMTAATRSSLTRAATPSWTTMITPSTIILQLSAVSPSPAIHPQEKGTDPRAWDGVLSRAAG